MVKDGIANSSKEDNNTGSTSTAEDGCQKNISKDVHNETTSSHEHDKEIGPLKSSTHSESEENKNAVAEKVEIPVNKSNEESTLSTNLTLKLSNSDSIGTDTIETETIHNENGENSRSISSENDKSTIKKKPREINISINRNTCESTNENSSSTRENTQVNLHCQNSACKCSERICCSSHCDRNNRHCDNRICRCRQDQCCKLHCSTQTNPNSLILYDSLVSYEKEYLVQNLKDKILENETSSSNFIFWFSAQFETMKVTPPSPTLVAALTHLVSKTEVRNLFIIPGNEEKQAEYYSQIKNEEPMEFEDVDLFSLAKAVFSYVEAEILIFEPAIIEILMNLNYNESNNPQKSFIIKRIPFILQDRDIFILIRKIILDQNKNVRSSSVDIKASTNLWGKMLLKDEDGRKCSDILHSLVKEDCDYFPLEFYE